MAHISGQDTANSGSRAPPSSHIRWQDTANSGSRAPPSSHIRWQDFEKCGIRVGTIVKVDDFPEAKKPAYKLLIDFGAFGMKKSSAQVTKLYTKEQLVGKQVICVTNFPPKQIGNVISEVLTTGFVLENGDVVLAVPERHVPNGTTLA